MKRTLFSYFERHDPESESKIKKKEKQIENTEKSNLEENPLETVEQSAAKNTSIQNENPPSFKNDIASATTKLSSKKNANEILNIVNDSWVPPADFLFPKSTTKNLSFQRKWLEEFCWLAYSAKENGAYCKLYDVNFIAVTVVLIILLGISIIFIVLYLKREREFKKELALAGLPLFENGAVENWNPDLGVEEQAELLPYDKRWEFPREKLKLGKQLGSGAFGVVFEAEAIGIIDEDTTSTVAVKMVKPNTDPSYVQALAAELKIMIHLGRHLNIVNLLGAYTGKLNKRELMVIVEYCRFGNIHQFLLKERNYFINQVTPDDIIDYNIKTIYNMPGKSNISKKSDDDCVAIGTDGYLVSDTAEPDWQVNYQGNYKSVEPSCTHDLINWSFQVARGMEYLASRKILHGDLASRNILLTEGNIVKICDFGLAKIMYTGKNYKKKSDKCLLPVKWMAIESLRDRVFSTQSDVWAFGIVLWEIFSLSVTPYPKIQNFNDLFEKLIEGYRMEPPKYANSDIYNIMMDCWKMNPMERPSFTDLAKRLNSLLQDKTKYYFNDLYMKEKTTGSLSTDYLSILPSATYLNFSTVTDHNLSNTCHNHFDHSENKDDTELKPMLHSDESPSLRNPTQKELFC